MSFSQRGLGRGPPSKTCCYTHRRHGQLSEKTHSEGAIGQSNFCIYWINYYKYLIFSIICSFSLYCSSSWFLLYFISIDPEWIGNFFLNALSPGELEKPRTDAHETKCSVDGLHVLTARALINLKSFSNYLNGKIFQKQVIVPMCTLH